MHDIHAFQHYYLADVRQNPLVAWTELSTYEGASTVLLDNLSLNNRILDSPVSSLSHWYWTGGWCDPATNIVEDGKGRGSFDALLW
jgi:hypothetical protein